jgi:hypothetical protein
MENLLLEFRNTVWLITNRYSHLPRMRLFVGFQKQILTTDSAIALISVQGRSRFVGSAIAFIPERSAIALSHNRSSIALELIKRDLLRDHPHFRTGATVILGRRMRMRSLKPIVRSPFPQFPARSPLSQRKVRSHPPSIPLVRGDHHPGEESAIVEPEGDRPIPQQKIDRSPCAKRSID